MDAGADRGGDGALHVPAARGGTYDGRSLSPAGQAACGRGRAVPVLGPARGLHRHGRNLRLLQPAGAVCRGAGGQRARAAPQKGDRQAVGLIGHFPWTDEVRAAAGELTIFEQRPSAGDLPQQAEEYLLPAMDVVAISGSAITNKSLPRLLELASHAWVMLIGPSTPLSVLLFDYGVDALAGCVARDPAELAELVQEGGGVPQFKQAVRFVTIQKP